MMATSAKAMRAGRAFVEISGDDSKLQKTLRAVQSKLKAFATVVSQAGLAVGAAGTAVFGMGAGFTLLSKKFADTNSELWRFNKATGTTAKGITSIEYALEKVGAPAETARDAITDMQASLNDAAGGSFDAAAGFARLGLSIADLAKMSPEQQFATIADRLAEIKQPALQAALATEVLGSSGAKLIPLFEQGPGALRRFSAEAERLGLTLSNKDAAAAARLKSAFDTLGTATKAAFDKIMAAAAPVMTKIVNWSTEVVASFARWIEASRNAQTAFGALVGSVMSGNLSAAMEVAAAQINLTWKQAMAKMREAWEIAAAAFKSAWTKASFDVQAAFVLGSAGIQTVFSKLTAELSKVWATHFKWLRGAWQTETNWLANIFGEVIAKFDPNFDLKGFKESLAEIDKVEREKFEKQAQQPQMFDKQASAEIAQINARRDAALAELDKAQRAAAEARSDTDDAALKTAEEAVAAAQKRLAEAVAAAKKAIDGSEDRRNQISEGMMARGLGLPSLASSVVGTFDPGAVRGLGGQGSTLMSVFQSMNSGIKATAANTAKTAANTAKGAAFT